MITITDPKIKQLISKAKKIEWECYGKRNSIFLLKYIFYSKTKESYQKVFGIKNSAVQYRTYNRNIYYSKHENIRIISEINKNLKKDQNYLMKLAKASENYCEEIDNLTKKLIHVNYNSYNHKNLAKEFKKIIKEMKYCSSVVLIIVPLEPFLEKELKKRLNKILREKDKLSELEYYVNLFKFPSRINHNIIERKKILQIGRRIQKNIFLKILFKKDTDTIVKYLPKRILNEIKSYLQDNSWILTRQGFLTKEMTMKDAILRIKNTIKKDCKEEIINLDKNNKEHYQKILQEIKYLNLKTEDKIFIESLMEWIYIRTLRTDVIYRSFARLKPMLNNIASRFQISLLDILHMSPEEIIDALNTLPDNNVLESRKNANELLSLDNECYVLDQKELEQYYEEFKNENDYTKINELKGKIGNKGYAKGKAKVITHDIDIDKVEENDILIAFMTNPSHVPAMERASGFVTNEGGILSHAAILAREMQKPCIIGTEIATEVFKDGDMIEVDADNGIVRKLEE
ncbi:MAG: PEP-utilizing enzyme [Candidatus Woesearchaeota archaeon]